MLKRSLGLAASFGAVTAACLAQGPGRAVVGPDHRAVPAAHFHRQPPAPVFGPPPLPADLAMPHVCGTCDDGGPCIAAVMRHETPDDFKGNGFVARKHPQLPSLHTFERAGNPQHVTGHAIPSYDHNYRGYYVGGGASSYHHGSHPGPAQGTFGVDYVGHHPLRHRVALLFSNGRKYQGGTGAYRVDPYEEIPNIFAVKLSDRVHRHFGHGAEVESIHE